MLLEKGKREVMLRGSTSVCRSLELVTQAARYASAATAAAPTGKRIKTFEIYRFNPEEPGAKPKLQVGLFNIYFH